MVAGLVTVVVPIYNVQKYLDKCVSSIVKQTYTDMEIILVDDGSPDNCPQMCEDWAAKDTRIRVIHKKNAGLGMARNTGIDHANGEYICFFDSDDYIEADTIEMCMKVAKEEKADIIAFGNDRVTQQGGVLSRRIPSAPQSVFSGEDIKRILLPKALSYDPKTGENWNLSLSGCFALFSMNLIVKHQWRFVSEREIVCEDFYSVLEIYSRAERVAIISKVFYHYVVNCASLSHTYKDDKYKRFVYFYKSLLVLCDELEVIEFVAAEAAAIFVGLTIGCFKQIVGSTDSKTTKLRKMSEIIHDSCIQEVLQKHDFSGDNCGKKMLWKAIQKKNVKMCYYLVQMRNIKEKINEFGIKS